MIRNTIIFSTKQIINFGFVRGNLKELNKITANYCMNNYCNHIIRNYVTVHDVRIDQYNEIPIRSLNDYKSQNGTGLKYMKGVLQQLFQISNDEIKELIKICPILRKVSCELVQKNYNLYETAGITHSILLQYPLLLTLEHVEPKLKYLQKLDVDINALAPMLVAGEDVLKKIVEDFKMEAKRVPHGNRIIYMSKLMNVPPHVISEKLISHTYVLRLPLRRLEIILKILLDYGVQPKDILKDCWALRYNPHIAEERLQKAVEANVGQVKTWMIRCTYKVFDRCIMRKVENLKVLGSHSTVEEYLSNRLECSIENATYLTNKYPAIMKMSIVKMKEIFDFLYSKDYTPMHICRVPRILVHSSETTKLRLEQLKQLGYVPISLAIFCKSKRDFDKVVNVYVKRRKNSIKEEESKNKNN